ncbi:helix-turn-helix transcriptional regulator [Shewanella sp. SR44-3]|uniref:helix-turn-helix transcriptional regulator n=1 Tax=Shewanella sp. SR44-3 TaxID=2760936 RepID=UPI0015FE0D8D|nr:helix-turn-helix transcriptional regulator [Shewanella sp. SR44-3]MBB1269711.1 helix-turn-helix transcriptional regulator [Shewanella sp. SR44-3]
MEMKINTEKVIAERRLRAWSQQHLADASGVSLRTIQRVENNGTSSLETVKALASCLELEVSSLFVPDIIPRKAHYRTKVAVLSSLVIAIFSNVLFLSPSSVASDISIKSQKIESSINNDYRVFSQGVEIFLPKDVTYEVLIDSQWETDTPSVASGSVKIYLAGSVILIDKAIISKMENGTKITTDYAKLSKFH